MCCEGHHQISSYDVFVNLPVDRAGYGACLVISEALHCVVALSNHFRTSCSHAHTKGVLIGVSLHLDGLIAEIYLLRATTLFTGASLLALINPGHFH